MTRKRGNYPPTRIKVPNNGGRKFEHLLGDELYPIRKAEAEKLKALAKELRERD